MAWFRNKKTGGWFEVDDEKASEYMNKKIRDGAKRTIKGPRTKQSKANAAYKEAWNKETENVERAERNYQESKKRPFETGYSKSIDNDYENSRKTKEDKLMANIRQREYERSRNLLENSLRHERDNAEDTREMKANAAYKKALVMPPKAYKRQGSKTNVTVGAQRAATEEVGKMSKYNLSELMHQLADKEDRASITYYERMWQDVARKEWDRRYNKKK